MKYITKEDLINIRCDEDGVPKVIQWYSIERSVVNYSVLGCGVYCRGLTALLKAFPFIYQQEGLTDNQVFELEYNLNQIGIKEMNNDYNTSK